MTGKKLNLFIQIKICAEYRDMVPKAKTGLSKTWAEADRPKPRCTGQTDRAPGTATVPSAIVNCHQNEAAHQTIKSPSMPYVEVAAGWKHSGIYVTALENW